MDPWRKGRPPRWLNCNYATPCWTQGHKWFDLAHPRISLDFKKVPRFVCEVCQISSMDSVLDLSWGTWLFLDKSPEERAK